MRAAFRSAQGPHLVFTAALASAATFLTVGAAQAQTITCTISNDICVFSNGATTATPFSITESGTAGSGSTDGGSGSSFTVETDSDIGVSLGLSNGGNPSNLGFGMRVSSAGGEGSSGGPSSGGPGGNLGIDPAGFASLTVTADFTSASVIRTYSIESLGGNGNDDNSNNKSSGGAGGDAGTITFNGSGRSTTLSTTITGTQSDNDLLAIDLLSQGGTGGRGNQGGSFTPLGGDGGDGNTVTGMIGQITVGRSSNPMIGQSVFGLRAQSIGGRGPNDFNSSDDETQGGGGSSTGGSGGTVNLSAEGLVTVIGEAQNGAVRGLFVRSEGGEGGWSYNVGVLDSFTAGGSGGAGGTAKITVEDAVATTQTGTSKSTNTSAAIFSLSRGGDGGTGQSGVAGGAGGTGGAATIVITSEAFDSGEGYAIHATGTAVNALFAKSQGGVGGDGLEDANGSTGGQGGNAGAVTVTVDLDESQQIRADASSAGSDSGAGIVAQSIGNFGGPGSDGNAVFGSPGSAGAGGNGGSVVVNMNSGSIRTDGTLDLAAPVPYADGILAQSIGGGGGTGGDFQGLFAGEGGAGGKGGNGGNVTVTNAGTITANGAQANGILAQSIGGGGGAGGVSDAVVFALGGNGGSGGESGTVTVENSGAIATSGYGAAGILAQSIVGGGGAAGVSGALLSLGATGGSDAGTAPGTVTVANTGTVTTQGDAAIGVHVQSIGGGGGIAAGSAQSSGGTDTGIFTLGTDGGDGGDGGMVTITDVGTISTEGAYSHGLSAQSIGGGGGNGGDAFSASVLTSVSTAVGGQSGGGGAGGRVSITTTAPVAIQTSGEAATGILAQSVGGGGGSGGDATTESLLDLAQLDIGGGASDGGTGGAVSVALGAGTITTKGNRGTGIVAQSIGGGGGSGGAATSSAASFISIGFAVGGKAGDGGSGGTAEVSLSGTTIATATGQATASANDAAGVLVQSIGGGGGIGGGAVADALTTGIPIDPEDPDLTITANAQFSVGGAGGGGGSGSTAGATIADGSSITTNGAGSVGVLVQSIGGGGGNGGDASTATTTVPDSTQQYSLTINAALGGAGGDGGGGGSASVTLGSQTPSATATRVATTGQYANAVLAQSIGGGGGNSGAPSSQTNALFGQSTVSITIDAGSVGVSSSELGASGGAAVVSLYADSRVVTEGDGARGVIAQSIGGGGGTVQGGEIQLGADISGSEDDTYEGTATVALGQKGGAGGAGGEVTLLTVNGASIATSGIDADGILAQSIGGGGGLAGTLGSSDADSEEPSGSDDGEDDEDINVSLTVAVGGAGGTGGTGGAVSLTHSASVSTAGDWADAIVMQSIGGGGGTGGTSLASGTGESAQINVAVGGTGGSGGNASSVSLNFDDTSGGSIATTEGYMAHGVLLQSIGGGGGQGGDGSQTADGTIGVGSGAGGSGGSGGSGSTVTVRGFTEIETSGNDAHGLIAQSIGGGGGIGGGGTSDSSDGDDDYAIDINVGGGGGASGAGGTIDFDAGVVLSTAGARAFGIVAQSIGGGGGIGGAGDAQNVASVNVGGTGGAAGDGGAVGVTVASGDIDTAGAGAHGIIAQSVGGGGGLGGDLGVGGITIAEMSGGGNGSGGAVSVSLSATVTTRGAGAHGIIAQSIGGGGGIEGSGAALVLGSGSGGSGTGGAVTVTQSAAVSSTGAGAYAIIAQSEGATGNGTVSVSVNDSVTGGTNGGSGVLVLDGSDNVITVASGGTITASSGGTAIQYLTDETGSEGGTLTVTVEEGGTITGNVIYDGPDAGDPITVINNSSQSLRGARRYEADVVNSGRLLVGFGRPRDTTRITGSFNQTEDGVLEIGTDFAGRRTGRLIVEEDADIDGTIIINAQSLTKDTVLEAVTVGGALTGSVVAQDTAAVDYRARVKRGVVTVSVDAVRFENAFSLLSRNERQVGRHLDDIFQNGSGGYAVMLAEFNNLTMLDDGGASYAAALSALSPGGSQAAAAVQASLAQSRLSRAMACPAASAGTALATEDGCVWFEGGASSVDQGGEPGYDGRLWGIAAGGEIAVHENWSAGLALGYQSSDFDSSDNLSSADGDSFYLAAAVTREFGGFALSGGVAGSFGRFDVDRRVSVPGFSGVAKGESDIYTLSARARAAYTFGGDAGYIRPFVDVDLVHTSAGGYTETGAGLYNLTVEDETQTALIATPAVEVGATVDLSAGWAARLFANAGVSFSTQDDWTTDASLAGAPAGTDAFETVLPVADIVGRIGVGAQISSGSGFDARAEYDGVFGDDYSSHSGTFRLTKRF